VRALTGFGYSQEDAEDAYQEAAYRLLRRNTYQTDGPASFLTWVIQVARRCAWASTRRERRAQAVFVPYGLVKGELEEDVSMGGEDDRIRALELRRLYLAVEEDKDGQMLIRHNVMDESTSDLARAYGRCEKTIERRMLASKLRLREITVSFRRHPLTAGSKGLGAVRPKAAG
jgi:predicted RNA polymerase sigma factor